MKVEEALTKAAFLKEHPPAIYPPQLGVLDLIDTLAAEVRRLREGGWISVEERLPLSEYKAAEHFHVQGEFLVVIKPEDTNDDIEVVAYEYNTRDGWCYYDGTSSPFGSQITHWMPLPSPPNG